MWVYMLSITHSHFLRLKSLFKNVAVETMIIYTTKKVIFKTMIYHYMFLHHNCADVPRTLITDPKDEHYHVHVYAILSCTRGPRTMLQ